MEPPEPATTGLRLLALIGLIVANAFFVAAEFGLVGARKTRLDELARGGDRRAALARRMIGSLERYISATQLGITLCSLAIGWIGEPALANLIERGMAGLLPEVIGPLSRDALGTIIAFSIITFVVILVGELLPKAIALLHPEGVSRWVSAPLLAFGWLMAGPIYVLNRAANRLLRLLRIRVPSHRERLHSPEEIRMLVEQSEEGGRLEKEDARLIEGVFEFSEKNAEDVMTPRTEMVALDADDTVEAAADVVARAGRSRYPVFQETLDDIVGVVHSKDILRAIRQQPGASIRSILRPPLFVPGTREVEDVLADMKRLKVHLAVVLDEYGGTAGLVTMEDLLEEIVGAIYDEYDQPAPPPPAGATPLLDGAMPVTDFNDAYDATLDDTAYTTLGGFLFGELGRLPRTGDRVTTGGWTFEISEMDGRRVKGVRLVGREAVSGEAER
jgi:CBS domain containing-hemolysin-like protein